MASTALESVTNRELIFSPRAEQSYAFELRTAPLVALQPGEVRVRNLLFSCDPTQIGWLSGGSSYAPPVLPGQVMRAWSAGHVVESRNQRFAVGDRVWGTLAWEDYSVSSGAGILPLAHIPADIPLSFPLSITGINGVTAYVGMVDFCQVRAGETVVVSSAAGATGSAAVQLAKLRGAHVIGIAGGPDKTAWLKQSLQLGGAIDYKGESVADRLTELCPRGIDVYFDNVGGATLDAALAKMATHGRVVLCGATSQYGGATPLNHVMAVLARTLTMRGLLVMDHLDRFDAISTELTQLAREGALVAKEDIVVGLENAPTALLRLFEGKNLGKQLVALEGAPALESKLCA